MLEKPSESTQQDSKSQTNYTPWIVGGIIGVGLIIGVAIWLVLKNQRKNAQN